MSNCIHGFAQGECAICEKNTEKKNMYYVPQLISKINNNEPRFTYNSSIYKGNLIMEIFKDGEPFWEDLPGAKKHFRFGSKKAHMILNCMPIIHKFFQSDGRIPNEENTDETSGLRCKIRRLYHKGNPYLKIEACDKTLNFGLLKSKSIIELEREIKMFCDKGYW